MKIERIHMTAFRSAQNLTLSTAANRVLIAGKNHSGKSGIREAVRWVLTGRSSVTDARGSGADALIPTGGDVASVVLEVEGLGGVTRSHGAGEKVFSVSTFTGDNSSQQQALYARLNTTPEMVDAVLDTNQFLRLNHADAKALVLGLLNVKLTVDGVEKTLEEADALYDSAFEGRKVAKRVLKSFSVPPMPVSPLEPGKVIPKVEQVEEQLTRLRETLQAASGAAGVTVGKREALQATLATLKAQTPYKGDLAAEECERQIGLLDSRVRELEHEAESAVAPADVKTLPVAQQVQLHRKVMTALVEHRVQNGCVLDGNVPCETAKIKFTNRSKELQKVIDELEKGGQSAPAEVKGGESPIQAARKKLQILRTMQARYIESSTRMIQRDAEVDKLGKQILALPDTRKTEEEIATFKTRIQKGEQLLQQVRGYWTAVYQHQEGVKTRGELDATVTALEARCEVLGPNGVRAEALQTAIGAFQDLINPVTGAFGWTVKFEVDPWQVVVNDRAIESFSESEQFLVGMSIQLAIAQVSGLSFAIVDRLDVLDVAHRAIATKLLMESSVGQIFILATREPEQKLPAAKAGVIAYRFKSVDGWTQVAESVGI